MKDQKAGTTQKKNGAAPPRSSGPAGMIKRALSRENIEALVIAVALALFIRTFVVQAFKIPSGSMEPTLLIGDHILVNKFIYGISIPFVDKKFLQFKRPERSDVIVFIYPMDESKDFIKRVVAKEGDTVEVRQKKVYINGSPVDDPHAHFTDSTMYRSLDATAAQRDNYGPKTVPPGHVFVMGDNRDRSLDSRFWGFVDINKIRGKAFIIYWSWEAFLSNFRWRRLGMLIE